MPVGVYDLDENQPMMATWSQCYSSCLANTNCVGFSWDTYFESNVEDEIPYQCYLKRAYDQPALVKSSTWATVLLLCRGM